MSNWRNEARKVRWHFFLIENQQIISLNEILNMNFSRGRILFHWTLNDYRAAIQITFRKKIAWLNQKIHFRKNGSSQIYFTLPVFFFHNSGRWNLFQHNVTLFFMSIQNKNGFCLCTTRTEYYKFSSISNVGRGIKQISWFHFVSDVS
jgi:hypothetical protein